MSDDQVGGERCTFGRLKDEDFELLDLPAIASPQEIDMDDFVQITIECFATAFLICYAEDAAQATTKMTTKEKVIKKTAGQSIGIPVAGVKGKMFVAAESGGPVADDLQVIKVRSSG